MNTVGWILQVVCALVFLGTGLMKLVMSREDLSARFEWVKAAPELLVRGIGFIEVLGAIGLIAPALSGILLILTPLAAAGLALTMLGASVTNIRHRAWAPLGLSFLLLLACVLVAVVRFAAPSA